MPRATRGDQQTISQPTYVESLANELLAKYRKLDSVIDHPLTKGTYHEKILRDMVRAYLPNSFSVGEGFIINTDAKTSSQLDILIVDNLDPRSFGYKESDFFIASDLAVTCFGEVKTYCTKKDFVRSFHNLINSKAIITAEPVARVTSFLFCYDAYASAASFSNWVDYSISQLPDRSLFKPWHYPNYVFCLKKKVMLEKKTLSPTAIQYFTATPSNPSTTSIEQKMIQDIFQCVTDGCGRQRIAQGITLLRP